METQHPKQNKSTEEIKETTDNLTVTQETTLSYSTESTLATTNETNAKNICTRTLTTTLSTKTTTDSPPRNVSGVQSETSTNLESTDHRNPVSFTTVYTFMPSNETLSTTKMAETTETTKSTEITTMKSIIETSVNSAPIEESSSVKFNSVSPRDPCSAYPKHCDRPTSWETTVKGETRDFYRILKARYGDRMKILKRTTNWARRMKILNGIKPDFYFGRHIES
ncbi:hypothetical protein RR48_07315 [Papilio machaon]|uniref:Uncharacterized protein n=1 Tax=Papilio machaon TaxID=76193 RepID=A0A194RJB3_PAPMA|nr:hypothetical protein RR48_07315 [Papilio machaon]